jgi:hypothetical protein
MIVNTLHKNDNKDDDDNDFIPECTAPHFGKQKFLGIFRNCVFYHDIVIDLTSVCERERYK